MRSRSIGLGFTKMFFPSVVLYNLEIRWMRCWGAHLVSVRFRFNPRLFSLRPAEAQHRRRGPGPVRWEDCRGEHRWLRHGPVTSLWHSAGQLQLRRTGQADQQQEVSFCFYHLTIPSVNPVTFCLSFFLPYSSSLRVSAGTTVPVTLKSWTSKINRIGFNGPI